MEEFETEVEWPDVPETPENTEVPATPEEKPKKQKKNVRTIIVTAIVELLVILLLLAGLVITGNISLGNNGVISASLNSKLTYIKTLLDLKYIYNKDTDYDDAIIKAYIDSFDDGYTTYYTKKEYESIFASLSGSFYGIGVSIQHTDEDRNIVVQVNETGAAFGAGVLAGDEIVGVDGQDVKGFDLDSLVALVRGELGTEVVIRVYREETNEYLDLSMKRALVEETVAESYYEEEDKIGYIYLSSFTSDATEQVKKLYAELKEQGMEGLILDIRSNGGGLYDEAIELADMMLPECLVSYMEDKAGNQTKAYSTSFQVLDVPMVLLVDDGSASSSEVFAGAIQYYGAATIVGTQTFGKGIVQTLYGLSDGSVVKFTTARFYNPGGVCIHEIGITPDVVCEYDKDAETDTQYDKAVEVLKEMMK